MKEKTIVRKNNFIFFSVVILTITYVIFKDNFLNYEDDKSFVSEFIRTSKYQEGKSKISSFDAKDIIFERSDLVIKSIKFKNFTLLRSYVHPKYGIRFSPDIYVMSSDILFNADNLESRFNDNYIYDWGSLRNLENMKMNFRDYYRKFIYNHDYALSNNITYNDFTNPNNIVDNTYNFYPDSIVVEYSSDNLSENEESYLRLVFEEYKNDWFLSGIITVNNNYEF
ncbi:MAG: hypothetical protein ISQ32_04520 [Rickettsiales bacterium]|nr:hypothetical protein [Rickettsiales bacterium]